MHPIIYKFNLLGRNIVIGTYGVFMVLAIGIGIIISILIAKKFGYDYNDFFLYATLIIAGIIGGAVVIGFIIFMPERIEYGFWDYPPAMVSWGGILGGLGALISIKKHWKENPFEIGDISTPGYLIGLGIGRIGCYFGGCCYGVTTASCIGVTFTDPLSPASLMEQPLIPTQLISALFLILAGTIFIIIVVRRKIIGLAFLLSIIVYSLFRFIIEFWRADPRIFLFGFSDGQLYAIISFVFGMITLVYLIRKHQKNQSSGL